MTSPALAALEGAERRPGRLALYLRSLAALRDPLRLARLDLPWWSFAAAERVEEFLRERRGAATAFEYGPGASTAWLARRCRRVAYVEHDARWWPAIRRLTAGFPHVRGVLAPPRPLASAEGACRSGRLGHGGLDYRPYVEAIRQAGGPFDLIVIDGRARTACLREAVRHLKPEGAIVFDNTERARYREALARAGCRVERFYGLTPAAPYPTETSLLHPLRAGA
ncbi:class I SAM-dependent methyltransferase [Crenalkalicoccus roseus]|uniref:class I SAM-dependent methyltransferase n=1 Tax=Crenalkalicoccus roseus TaxID=1485588 RepID=UPI0010812774|nr:class I SAM-dependent methyltransferase [Crenalkalicoccus roseus]